LFGLTVLLVLVCCKPKTASNQSVDSVQVQSDEISLPQHLSFDDVALYDTLSFSNIIESVRYIPLDNRTEALIANPSMIRLISGKYLILSGSKRTAQTIKIFNPDGSFLAQPFHIGRGPNEALMIGRFTAHDSTNLVTIPNMADKMLTYNITTGEIKGFRSNVDRFYQITALPNGNFISLCRGSDEPGRPNPVLFHLNQNFEITDSVSDMKDRTQRAIEGVTEGNSLRRHLKAYNDGVIYLDMLSDTVFYVDDNLRFTPMVILDFGKKQPTLHNSIYDSAKKKEEQIYIYDIDLSGHYFFATYQYKGMNFESIWDLMTGKMVYSSHANLIGLHVRLNEFRGRLYGYGLSGNKIIAAVNAIDLLNAITGLTPDDNSVLVEITLK
jgi:hypothetical protein